MNPPLTSTLLVAVLLIAVATMARMNPPPSSSVTGVKHKLQAQVDVSAKTAGWFDEDKTVIVENKGAFRDQNGKLNTS